MLWKNQNSMDIYAIMPIISRHYAVWRKTDRTNCDESTWFEDYWLTYLPLKLKLYLKQRNKREQLSFNALLFQMIIQQFISLRLVISLFHCVSTFPYVYSIASQHFHVVPKTMSEPVRLGSTVQSETIVNYHQKPECIIDISY